MRLDAGRFGTHLIGEEFEFRSDRSCEGTFLLINSEVLHKGTIVDLLQVGLRFDVLEHAFLVRFAEVNILNLIAWCLVFLVTFHRVISGRCCLCVIDRGLIQFEHDTSSTYRSGRLDLR